MCSVRHLSGRPSVALQAEEAAVTCLVRNGEYYIRSFIEHYKEKGFRHIFLLDNGSTDGTIPCAAEYPEVSLYQTRLPVSRYQAILKKTLVRKAVRGGWCLDVDIDEFFDYPYSHKVALAEFLRYLNENRYTAVVTQMLDLFSDKPLGHLAEKQVESIKEQYRYYDLSAVEGVGYGGSEVARRYGAHNELSNANIQLYYGGIRKALYGIHCLLSKHSLFARHGQVELFPHVHFVDRARLADVSCVLKHYKLTSSAMETSLQNKGAFTGTSQGYADFIRLVESQPNGRIGSEHAQELKHLDELIRNGFLVVSDGYRAYVDSL